MGIESILQPATKFTMMRGHDTHWREVCLSSGGPGNGKFWTSIPRGRSEYLGTDHFITALRLRLAGIDIMKGAMCQMELGKGEDSRCGDTLDRKGEHLLKCKKGRARFALSKADAAKYRQLRTTDHLLLTTDHLLLTTAYC